MYKLRNLLNENEVSELTDKTYVSAAQKALGQRRTGQSDKFATVLFKKYFDQRVFFLEPIVRSQVSFAEIFGLAIEADNRGFRIENNFVDVFFDVWEFDNQYKESRVPEKFWFRYRFDTDDFEFSYKNTISGNTRQKSFRRQYTKNSSCPRDLQKPARHYCRPANPRSRYWRD